MTTVRERPDLLPIVAEWTWREWWDAEGMTLEQTIAVYADCVAERGAPQTFVLLEDDRPVGTATLAREDLDERPELTPWLAGVFVVPDRRGAGVCSASACGVRGGLPGCVDRGRVALHEQGGADLSACRVGNG